MFPHRTLTTLRSVLTLSQAAIVNLLTLMFDTVDYVTLGFHGDEERLCFITGASDHEEMGGSEV